MTTRSALRRTARSLAAPAVVCLTLTALAAPAAAARPDSSSSVRSGDRASVSWTELDPGNTLGLPGNTHVGNLWVEDGAYGTFAYGVIVDLDCDPGETPAGGHGDPGTCDPAGERFLDGDQVDLTVSDTTARLTGTLVVSNGGHGEPGSVLARVPADITWTSTTALSRYRGSSTYTDSTGSYRSRTTGLRSAPATTVVTGSLGRMGFADDRDDVSSGTFETYTETSRQRTR